MYCKNGNWGNFFMIWGYVNLRTFFNPENQFADKNQLFPCLILTWSTTIPRLQSCCAIRNTCTCRVWAKADFSLLLSSQIMRFRNEFGFSKNNCTIADLFLQIFLTFWPCMIRTHLCMGRLTSKNILNNNMISKIVYGRDLVSKG